MQVYWTRYVYSRSQYQLLCLVYIYHDDIQKCTKQYLCQTNSCLCYTVEPNMLGCSDNQICMNIISSIACAIHAEQITVMVGWTSLINFGIRLVMLCHISGNQNNDFANINLKPNLHWRSVFMGMHSFGFYKIMVNSSPKKFPNEYYFSNSVVLCQIILLLLKVVYFTHSALYEYIFLITKD